MIRVLIVTLSLFYIRLNGSKLVHKNILPMLYYYLLLYYLHCVWCQNILVWGPRKLVHVLSIDETTI